MASFPTAEILRAKTREARRRIHAEKYASFEEVEAWFQNIVSERYHESLRKEVLDAVHAGKIVASLRIPLPTRIYHTICGSRCSYFWESYARDVPQYAKIIREFIQKVAEVEIRNLSFLDLAPGDQSGNLYIEVMWDD